MIIDLRGNQGGDVKGVGLDIASRLVSAKTSFGRFIDRDGVTPRGKTLDVTPRNDGYPGPLVILVDGSTRSAGEVFANGFQESGRAIIVGSVSCGCVFDIKTRDEPGGRLVYSHLAFRSRTGRTLEGAGVTPDVPAMPSLLGLWNGRDEVLEVAEEALRSRATGRR
jgi:carboxyl-terminal processing protease